MNGQLNLAILLFDDVEILDFCGPYEVFSVASRQTDTPAFNAFNAFNVFTVAEEIKPVTTSNGLSVNPDSSLDDCPKVDILLIPGGIGTRQQMENEVIIEWIRNRASTAKLVLSVCTGALLLAKSQLLNGLDVTTHHVAYDLLRELAPTATVHEDRRYLDNGKIVTAAGIAAGIDMSLHVVGRLHGPKVAAATANHMEYPWQEQS
jgi:transcriptional regulator GlxA family with amidase domain